MARPKAEVIISKQVDVKNLIEIIAADAMYIVLYKNRAINIKKSYWSEDGKDLSWIYKYHKVAFPNLAPARNLADRLNKEFNCTDFTVVEAC